MTTLPKCYGIIPTRYASSRFEGKPLALILGKPMIWHVYTRARQCPELEQVVLATDDDRIFNTARQLEIPVLMTSPDHSCGTERVLEAAQILKVPADGVILNIQGDEPSLAPEMLSELLGPFSDSAVQVTTLAHEITLEQAKNPDLVKVVLAHDHKALYFSRSPIPYPRDHKDGPYLGHIGLYGFRMKTLEKFVGLKKGALEQREKLEQLRLLEHGISIQVVPTSYQGYGVDRPEDIAVVEEILKKSASAA
ncbi:MAG: 3-deoxy-manno-octulosonate cytidylyltransferase [Proteobacteria bacterium]|nr:3-deoxy-manno-octulosonate cytidylyltransferase [Pseudomonadota bacterium]MBU1714470.1 3-deoxy-manno-octulosonate cytidylyltransferase [Pseudomonadota bacterium]